MAKGSAISADLKRRNVNLAIRSDECGLGIRTIDKGRIGSSTTHDPKRWLECLDAAIASGRLATPQQWGGLPRRSEFSTETLCYDPALPVDPRTASSLLGKMLEGAAEHPADVTSGTATVSSTTETVANSNGVRYTSRHTGVSVSLEAIKDQSTGS